jgi:putative acetyltransferase
MEEATLGVIVASDLDNPQVLELLAVHLATTGADVPLCSAHGLDASALRAPGIEFWALWNGDELLGFGALKELSPDHGEIKSMHVAEAKRRAGAGGAILTHIIAAARARGMRKLSLETGSAESFRPARDLYRAHGFSDCGPFGGYVPDPNNSFMSLKL